MELDLNPVELNPSIDIPAKGVDDSFAFFSDGKIEMFPFVCGLTDAVAQIDLDPVEAIHRYIVIVQFSEYLRQVIPPSIAVLLPSQDEWHCVVQLWAVFRASFYSSRGPVTMPWRRPSDRRFASSPIPVPTRGVPHPRSKRMCQWGQKLSD
jgi:hypothetical protein